jgi:hypothetical protein
VLLYPIKISLFQIAFDGVACDVAVIVNNINKLRKKHIFFIFSSLAMAYNGSRVYEVDESNFVNTLLYEVAG